jgi:hypothetical protein
MRCTHTPPLPRLANIEIQIKAPKITTQTLKYIPIYLPIPMNSILVIIGSSPYPPKSFFGGIFCDTVKSNQIKLEGGRTRGYPRLGLSNSQPEGSKIMLLKRFHLGGGLLFLSYSHDGFYPKKTISPYLNRNGGTWNMGNEGGT